MNNQIKIREARRDDVLAVTLAMMEAIGRDIMERVDANGGIVPDEDKSRLEKLQRIVERDDTLYSWRHALVAETADGAVAGVLISYDGDDYLERRNITFAALNYMIDFDVSAMDLETRAGEYYLDSLAIFPRWRNRGIGAGLLRRGIANGLSRGKTVVLACAPDNVSAHRLYESLGFRESGRMFIFGEDYLRMVVK